MMKFPVNFRVFRVIFHKIIDFVFQNRLDMSSNFHTNFCIQHSNLDNVERDVDEYLLLPFRLLYSIHRTSFQASNMRVLRTENYLNLCVCRCVCLLKAPFRLNCFLLLGSIAVFDAGTYVFCQQMAVTYYKWNICLIFTYDTETKILLIQEFCLLNCLYSQMKEFLFAYLQIK